MSDETATMVCEMCQQPIRKDEPWVNAIERHHVQTYGADEYVDGLRVKFHRRCYGGSRLYRQEP